MEVRDRILIVEDDKSIRNFLKAILEANEYDVILAATGTEAYSLITSRCPDLVILDLGLPDMDGMTILQKVREWTGMPVVVVSARSHERDKVEALDQGRLRLPQRACVGGAVRVEGDQHGPGGLAHPHLDRAGAQRRQHRKHNQAFPHGPSSSPVRRSRARLTRSGW